MGSNVSPYASSDFSNPKCRLGVLGVLAVEINPRHTKTESGVVGGPVRVEVEGVVGAGFEAAW